MAATPFIGLKRLWYGDVISTAVSKTSFEAWLKTAKEIKNVHEETWKYSQEDSTEEEYINELDGEAYYVDETKKGKKTIEFTIGEWEVDDRVALAGGTKDELGWVPPKETQNINKAFCGMTRNGNFILITKGKVVAKDNTQKKNIGLGIKVTALSNGDIPSVRPIDGKNIVIQEQTVGG